MLKYIRKEIKLNTSFYKTILLVMLITYITIETVLTAVILTAKTDTYMNFGVLTTFIFGGITITISICIKFYSGFENAVKMSISRKYYISGSLVSTLIALIEFCILIKFMSLIDKIYVATIFKGIVYNVDLIKWFDIKTMIVLLYLVVSLSIFCSAMTHKFGKLFFTIIFYIYITSLVLLSYRNMGIKFMRNVSDFFINLTQINNLLIILVVCTVLFILGVTIIKKESIKT